MLSLLVEVAAAISPCPEGYIAIHIPMISYYDTFDQTQKYIVGKDGSAYDSSRTTEYLVSVCMKRKD